MIAADSMRLIETCEHASRGGYGCVDIGVRMGAGYESSFECGRREVNGFVQHPVKEFLEALDVATHHLLIGLHGGFGSEEKAEHSAHMVRREGDFCLARRLRETLNQFFRLRSEARMKIGSLNATQRRETCGHCDRI